MKRKSIEEVLYDICENTHATCDYSCPVFELNGGAPLGHEKPFEINRGCDCFKNSKAMKKFIEKKEKETGNQIYI